MTRPAARGIPAAVLIAALAGCGDPDAHDPHVGFQRDRAYERVRQLESQNERLRRELRDANARIETLSALGEDRLEKLNRVQRVRFGSGTGGADLDDEPGDELVKVVLEPIDQDGAVVKAAGSVKLQLFDLAADREPGKLVAELSADPDAVSDAWASGFLSRQYGFKLPVDVPDRDRELTLRVEFVDYLTGRTFTAQQVVTLRAPGGA